MPFRYASFFRSSFSPLALLGAVLLLGAALAGCDAAGDEEAQSGVAFLEGLVADSTGAPVGDALVTAAPGGATTTSDSTGFYSLAVEVDSTTDVALTAEKPGLGSSTLTVMAQAGQTTETRITLTAGTASPGIPTVITGVVASVDAGPVSNARVTVEAGGQTYSTRVNAGDGTYRLEPRIPEATELTVRAISDEATAQRVVTVFPDGTREGVNFTLGSGTFTLSGQVRDGAGAPVAGARVVVPTNAQTAGSRGFTTQSDADGTFTLDVELTASTNLTVRAIDGNATAEQVVTAFPAQSQSGVALTLGTSPVTLEGTVADAAGNAISGARVEVQTAGQLFSAQTGTDGGYSLGVQVPRSTELTVRAVSGDRQAEETLTVFPSDEVRSGIDLVLDTGTATLEGAVTDGDGDGVSDARVEATVGGQTFSAQTAGDGSYTLNVQISGSMDLTVRAISDDLTAERTVSVVPGQTETGVDFVLGNATATVEGTVRGGDSATLAGVRVETQASGQTFSTQTDANGTYSLGVQVGGATDLTVRAVSDDLSSEQVVSVVPGQTREGVDFVLGAASAAIMGTVTDGNGDAVSDARVETTAGGQAFSAQTDGDGSYTLSVLIDGSTELTVRAVSNDRQAERTVTVTPGETDANVDFVLGSSTGAGTATVEGRVTDSGDNPVKDARVEVPASDQTIGGQPFTTQTDADGRYSLKVNLRSSTEVEVSAHRDDLTATKTVTVVPEQTREGVDFTLGGSTEESGTATIEGRVTTSNGDPVTNARVAALPNEQTVSDQPVTARTGNGGTYTLDVDITANTDLTVRTTSDGREAERVVTVFPDETRSGIDFTFDAGGGGEDDESGAPSNIQLLDVTRTTIGIQGSGSPETSAITYQVTDAAGNPVSLDNETPVQFDLSGASPQGASIAPPQTTTNDEGKVTANLSSGTEAGVVQIVASVDTGGSAPITSRPVSVTIHGGLPVERNFFARSSQTNVAADADSRDVTISVEVGDRYNNPVKPGTAVYFTTNDKGLIVGSALTDERGRGSVQLSLNGVSAGEVVIATAETANRNEQAISTETGVFLSGASTIEVAPTTVELDQTYTLTVADENGYPLAPGTNISVKAEGTKVKAVGNTDVTLDDYGFDGDGFTAGNIRTGRGITEFTFKAVEDLEIDEEGEPTLEAITVTATSPNGNLEIVLTSDDAGPNVVTTTKGATVRTRPNGTAVIRQ